LKDFEILQVCVFGIDVELNSGHRDIEVDAVEHLAESRTALLLDPSQGATESTLHAGREASLPSSALFDLCYI
jgi:hypothetical protein